MIKQKYLLKYLVPSSFAVILIFSGALQAAPVCSDIFGNSLNQATRGSDLGPIEWMRSLKQKIVVSKVVRNFDQNKYEESVRSIKANDLQVADDFRPRSLEEAIAYLDVQLEDMSISVSNMPVVLRHKAYKTVQKILAAQGNEVNSASENLANLIFRGHYTKPTSFAYLLTHSPSTAKAEMFVQHLYALEITHIVSKAYEYNPGPQRPSLIARKAPLFYKRNKEAITWTFWMGVSVATAVQGHSADALYLPNLNAFHLSSSRLKIEDTLVEKGLSQALVELSPEMQKTKTLNYYYSIGMKAMNWYLIGSLISVFLGNDDLDSQAQTPR